MAAFVLAPAARSRGGLRAVAATRHPLLQIARGVLLVIEICVAVQAFVLIGLVESHAVFALCPLIVAAFSGPVPGEKVGWRRRVAIRAGFWQPMEAGDWLWRGMLCIAGSLGHGLPIREYDMAEASALQPFAYLQPVFPSILGITVFGETVAWNVAAGAGLIVLAGLFTLWREHVRARR